tara:strand:+ start:64 stop:918 length:855 start_codon:yes stop_codon:yes gene_type:complete
MARGPREEPEFKNNMPHINTLARRKGQYIEFYSITHGYAVAFPAFITKLAHRFKTPTKEISQAQAVTSPVSVRTGGVKRSIDVSFQIVADSANSAKDNLVRLGALIRMLYPETEPVTAGITGTTQIDGGIKSPALWEVGFTNLISSGQKTTSSDSTVGRGITVIIEDFNSDFDLDSGFVESRTDNGLFPKAINVSMQMLLLPNGRHGWIKEGDRSKESPGFENFPFGVESQKTKDRIIYAPALELDIAGTEQNSQAGSDPAPGLPPEAAPALYAKQQLENITGE